MLESDKVLLERYRRSVDLTNFPKGFMRWYEHATVEEKNQWYEERFKCLKYPLFLSGFVIAAKVGDPDLPEEYVPILGMDFQENPHKKLFEQCVAKRPGEDYVLSDLDTKIKKRMILWSRGLFKTSAIIVDIVQTILNYPNVRICFLTGGDDLAKRQLTRVKRVFEKPSKRFRTLFPEYCLKSIRNKKIADETDPNAWTDVAAKLGTMHEFTVPCRTNDTFAEPTFAISTAKSVKSGSHFDIIYIDDLVNDQNYRSIKALEKCYQDYLDICPLLEPTGFIIMTGTRYSFGDTYERIQEKAKEEERELGQTIWKFSIRDCWSMGCQNCSHTSVYHDYDINILEPPCEVSGCQCIGFKENGSKGVLFPQVRTQDGRQIGHTVLFLEGERFRLGPEFFANQYENRPIAKEAQTFTETLIGSRTLHEFKDIPTYSQSFTFGVCDLAFVGQEGRDYSVMYICRMYRGQVFIFDCLYGNWDSGQVAENTISVLVNHRPAVLFFEKINGWEAYDKLITIEAMKHGIAKVPIQWEKMSQVKNAKVIRIGSIKGNLTSQRLWFYAGMPGYQILVQQLCKWPKLGRHDDFADCAGMVVAVPTGYQLDAPPVIESATNWLRKLNPTQEIDTEYGDGGCGTGINCGPSGDKGG
jgi:hypothetical protein